MKATKRPAKTKTNANPKAKAKAKAKVKAKTESAKTSGVESLVARWRGFDALVKQRGLGWALHYAPAGLRFAREPSNPRGANVTELLPADYRAFVAAVGYPIFGLSYYDSSGISFLPPSGIEQLSPMVFDAEGNEPRPSKKAPTKCFGTFFAGFELSDIEGFAFAPSADDDDVRGGGEAVVWRVEGAMLSEEEGSFTQWMNKLLDGFEKTVKKLSAKEIQTLEKENDGETDPHRVIDYSLDKSYEVPPYSKKDLALHWIENQSSDPYGYALIDDAGNIRIPMTKRFLSVKPFRNGIAEVILKDAEDGYSGPWSKIDVTGNLL